MEQDGTESVLRTSSNATDDLNATARVEADMIEFEQANLKADRERLKEMLRDLRGKSKKKADLHNLYYETGCVQYLAKNPYFENGTLAIIIVNSIWLAVDADYNNAKMLFTADAQFIVMENFFCFVFTFEIVVRFLAYRRKLFALKDLWFIFDFVLVAFMILETWVLTLYMALSQSQPDLGGNTSVLRLFRLMRLLRMARMVRVLRSMPELLILIRGMAAALRSVCYSLCLLIILMYIFGIIFVNSLKDTQIGDTYFSSVPKSMNSLLCYGTFYDNIGDMLGDLLDTGVQYYMIFMLFTFLAALMVMNLLIGVLCEVVSDVSAVEKDAILVDHVKDLLGNNLECVDTDSNGMISKEEFLNMMDNPGLIHALTNINLNVLGLMDLVDDVFIDGDVSIEDFMDYIVQFRGSNASVLKEVTDIKRVLMNTNNASDGKEGKKVEKLPSRKNSIRRLNLPQNNCNDDINANVHLVQISSPAPLWEAPVQPGIVESPFPPCDSNPTDTLARAVAEFQGQVTRTTLHVTSNMKSLQERIERLESTLVGEPGLMNGTG